MNRALFGLLFFLLASGAAASSFADRLASFEEALDAKVFVPNATFAKSPQNITIKAIVTNPFPEAMPFYILRQMPHGWEIIKLGGAIPPSSTINLNIEVELYYQKETFRKTRFAIVGKGPQERLYGHYFEIKENWSAYERSIRDKLGMALTLFVPLLGILVVVLIASLASIVYKIHHPRDYHMNILLSAPQEETFEEKVANFVVHPFFMLVEMAVIVVLALVMLESIAQQTTEEDAIQIIILSGVGAFVLPLIYFAGSWLLEKHEEGKPIRFFVAMFTWGMLAAFLSLIANSLLVGWLGGEAAHVLLATILIAPFVEEVLKGLGILLASGHKEYNDTLTGLLMGFSCGIGFAFIENWFYFAAKINPFHIGLQAWGMMMVYRSFFNTIAHGCFTAAVSAPIGYLKSIPGLRKFARLAFVPGLFLAIVIHIIFNLSALADSFVIASQQVSFFIFNPMLIIVLVAVFFLVLVLALIDEKKRKVEMSVLKAIKR
ncbi:MAG: PrsW family intramembrane metalloprotease [Candidatus Anstonellaceae archaeon]